MRDSRKENESGSPAVNGYHLTEEFFTGYSIETATIAGPTETADLEATRYLSAATQVNIEYAKKVVERVFDEHLKALAPTFGVDVPVVVKWAIRALRTRMIRDYSLTAILGLQVFLITILILWWHWAWIPLVLSIIAAWFVASWDHHERIHSTVIGKMLRYRFKPEEAPLPRKEVDRHQLQAIARRRDGNLVVFSGHSAFIGSGKLMYSRRLLLDISSRKQADEDSDKQFDPFTSDDIHAAIVMAFDRHHGLGKSLDNIRSYERLFVNGLHIRNNQQLLPDPLLPPPTSVDSTLLRTAAVNPSPEARTYVCVEMPGWQGQLVVTLFIRAVYAGKSLFVEWTFRVLPPIRTEFLGIDDLYEFSRYRRLKDSSIKGVEALVPALLGAPAHAFGFWHRPRTAKRHLSNYSRAIKCGYIFDYGADRSIREDASGNQRQHYFLARDETMYVLLAQQTLIRAVGDFLDDHGVDLGQFDDQVKVIFEQSINYNIGNITDSSGIVIGDKSSATVNESPKGQQ